MKKILFALVAASLLMPAGVVFAIEGRGNANIRIEANSGRAGITAETSVRADMHENREAFLKSRAELEARFKANREAIKARMQTDRAQMKARLAQFKDQAKASTTARIADNLDKVNEVITGRFNAHLDTMTTILDRVEAKVGADANAEFTANLTAARAAIATADAAVAAQAGVTYPITVTEATVRDVVKAAREKLHTDLAALRQKVEDARKAVHEVIVSRPQVNAEAKASTTVQ